MSLRISDIVANTFTKIGGTSSQFLKADGTIDSNAYLVSESDTLASVTGRGATTSTQVTLSGNLRMSSDIGIDAGNSIFFGKEESFGGTNTGGNDYGYIVFDNNNATYGGAGGTERSVLRIGTQNDGPGTNEDNIALEPTADLYLNPGGGIYRGNDATRYTIWDSGNLTNLNQLTNGPGYITSSSLGSYLPLAGGTMTGQILGPSTGSDSYGGLIHIRERNYVLATESAWSFSPAISFHWGDRHVKRLGLRSDGWMAVDDTRIVTETGTWAIDIAGQVSKTVAAGSQANWLYGAIATNDFFRVRAGGAENAGFLEIATADDGDEPIYVRQYTGLFATVARTLTLLDGSGNTSIPGSLTIGGYTAIHSGNIGSQSVNSSSTVTHYNARTDSTYYNVVWAAGNPSHMYSADGVQIQSSTNTLRAQNLTANGNLYAGSALTALGNNGTYQVARSFGISGADYKHKYILLARVPTFGANSVNCAFRGRITSDRVNELGMNVDQDISLSIGYANTVYWTTNSRANNGYSLVTYNHNGTNYLALYQYTAPNYYQGTFTGMVSDFGGWLDSNFLTVVELNAANHSAATYNQYTQTIMGNAIWHAGNDGAGSGLDADTVDGYNTIVAYNSNDVRNKILVAGSSGNISTQNPESYSGEVRLGAAWSRGGVYASGTLSMSTSSGNIDFISNDTVLGAWRWDSTNGSRFIVGEGITTTPYTLVDSNKRPIIYAHGRYPVLTLNHTAVENANHGPTIQFTHTEENKQWVIGTNGPGTRLDIGYSTATDRNPHNGIAGYNGSTFMRFTTTGVLIGDCGAYPTINTPNRPLHVNGRSYFNDNILIRPTSESWAEGLSFTMPTTSQWGGLRWRRERANNDGNWYVGFTALDSTDDLVIGANDGGTQRDNILRMTKGGYVIAGQSGFHANYFYQKDNIDYYLAPGADLSLRVYGEISNSNYQQGVMQPGALNIGRTDTNYRWDGGTWSSDVRLGILANCSEYWEIGIHDSGDSVMSALYFDGGSTITIGRSLGWGTCSLTVGGDITAFSDARVKENIKPIENALEKTLSLQGVSYNRTDSQDKRTKIGLIAQEVKEVVPEIVTEVDGGLYGVSYGNAVGLLIEAIKEQQKQIEELKSQIKNQ